jgi:alanyl-tRNA synthetase
MGLQIGQIRKLQETISTLPEVTNQGDEISKLDAVKLMIEDITELQKKGYSVEMIADVFSQNGMQIAVSTLKSYMTKVRTDKSHTTTKNRPQRGSSKKKNQLRLSKVSTSRPTKLKPESGSPEVIPVDADRGTPKSSQFVPREDTRDI